LVTEGLPGARSIMLGAWLRCGTRYEPPELNGISHFLEHMVFKGTPSRDAAALAREMESLGGQSDAYTAHELTCYTIQVLPEHLDRGLAVLADLVVHASLDVSAIELEKSVVIEEIREADDSPPDLVQEMCAAQAWGDHPLAYPVLGTAETVSALATDTLRAYHDGSYAADRLLLAAAGAVDHAVVAEAADHAFRAMPRQGLATRDGAPRFRPGLVTRRERIDQVHMMLAAPGVSATDPDRHALWVLDTLLGGTTCSRLFQEVRERRGLAYQVGSSWQGHRDSGIVMIEAVASPQHVGELLKVTRGEVEALLADGVSEADLAWVKDYAKTTVKLAAESVGAQLARLARGFFYEGRYVSLEEVLAQVDAVTADDVRRVAHRVFGSGRDPGGRWVLALVGPVTPRRESLWWKAVDG
jgi:predicted Zn-dependent peptidase